MLEIQTQKPTLIAFATGWGSEFGGINVFNTEFLQHLAFATQGRVSIVCIVPTASHEKIIRAHEQGVMLVPLPYAPMEPKFDKSHVPVIIEKLNEVGMLTAGAKGLVWLGHDRITGAVALQAKAVAGGRVALIHHMSYTHYEAYAETATSAYIKSEEQRTLFGEADVLFAVGPLLRDALQDMIPMRETVTLIPGLDELPVSPAPRTFTGFMSGRLRADAAKIKQGHLGVAAFANAHKRAYAEVGLPDALKNQPRLILRGVDMENEALLRGQPDATDWRRFAADYADRVVNIQALGYTTKRDILLDELSRATVALMPSWHEGFGLAGWEAVAAGVPLIISENSGLHQLLREHRNGAWLNWVFSVDVRGKVDEPFFHEQDLKAVSDKLLQIAKDPGGAREKAASLREGAASDFPWAHCVNSFLAGLQLLAHERHDKADTVLLKLPTSVVSSPAQAKESPLELPVPQWEIGSGLADSQLLRAEEAAVPFDSARDLEVTDLLTWAYSAEYPQALRLVTGAGGTGKTRLALELCMRLSKDGWACGFLSSKIGAAQSAGAWSELIRDQKPTLVVFDYAETRQETLIAFTRALLRSESNPHLRLLLLARDGGEWWDRLPMTDPVCEPFLSGYAASGPVALRPLHNSISGREEAYKAAVIAYAARLRLKVYPQIQVDLTGRHFERPLYVQIAALLALRGERPASAEGLTKALLNHERRYWGRLLRDRLDSPTHVGVNEDSAAELMTLATMLGGFSRPRDVETIWGAWVMAQGGSMPDVNVQRALIDRLIGLYPGQQGLQPLRPDLLGEALVAHSLLQRTGPSLIDTVLNAERHSFLRRNALVVLARLSKYRPDLEEVIVQGLIRNFQATIADILIVSAQGDSRLPEWTERAFMRLSLPLRYQATGMLVPLFKHQSLQLSDFACAVMKSYWEHKKAKFLKRPGDVRARSEYAHSASRYAIALARSGDTTSALIHAKESVDFYQQIASRSLQIEHERAASLTCYANRLAENGDMLMARSISQKALNIYEQLAVHIPRVEQDLATALCNHASSVSLTGEYTDSVPYALRGRVLFEKLASKNPARFNPDRAWSAGIYANCLSLIGSYDEALAYGEESLRLYEELAQQNPDRFDPEVASALANLSLHFSDLGEFTHALDFAEQSLVITQRISARRPLVHAERLYDRSLLVRWIGWLEDTTMQIVPDLPLPDPDLCRGHRIVVLQLYRAWVQACYQSQEVDRAGLLAELASIGSTLTLAEFKEIEHFWLCAAAWLDSHFITEEALAYAHSDWLTLWSEFVEQRGGRVPSWMLETAKRLGFAWPQNSTYS